MFELKVTCNSAQELQELAMRLTLPIVNNDEQQTQTAPSVPQHNEDSTPMTGGSPSLFEESQEDVSLVDNDGTPWDERIHAGTKTKTAKGVWKKRKGVDEATFNSVMAELTGTADSGGLNHSQLLDQMVSGFAAGSLSIFAVSDALVEAGISSLQEASGNIEMIEFLARKLGLIE